MHQKLDERVSESFEYFKNSDNSGNFSFASSFRSFRRQYKLLAISVGVCLALGFCYIWIAPKQYMADTSLLIEPDSYAKIGKDQAGNGIESADVDSQVEVLKSERVARAVIAKLNLQNDPEFNNPALASKVSSTFSRTTVRDTVMQRVLAAMAKKMDVKRVDKTYVIDVTFTTKDPEKSSLIANAITDAYLQEQLDAKFAITNKASSWLEERLTELKNSSISADAEVQRYRASNNLIESGGRLVNDQQVSQINSQLTDANMEAAKADARLANLRSIISNHQIDAAVSDSLASPVITELRTKYLVVEKRAEELQARVGPKHQQVLGLKAEMQSYEDQIFNELSRIAESYSSDAQIAHSRQADISRSLETALGASAGDNRNLVDLREKEREAEIYKTQYQSFLEKYQELVQQQTYPVAKARVITRADPPTGPSQPRIKLITAMSLFAGLAIGSGIIMMRETFDRSFRSASQVRDLGLAFLGVIPDYRKKRALRGPKANGSKVSSGLLQSVAISHPLSKVADTLRNTKLAIDSATIDGAHVIGVISINSGDGKTYVSSNLAGTLARGGNRVLLIDGDLRRHGLSNLLAPSSAVGLVDILDGRSRPLAETIITLESMEVDFLSAPAASAPQPSSADMLGSTSMAELISVARSHYKYIVIDLPPTAPLSDARAITPVLSDVVVVVHWGKTLVADVEELISQAPAIRRKCVGIITNMVDIERMSLYSDTPTRGYTDMYY